MSEELLTVGEVWGIRLNNKPEASWFDVCIILGVSDATGNCVAFSTMNGRYVSDFSHDGMPKANEMDGWERIL